MRVITQRDLILNIDANWLMQYPKSGHANHPDKATVYNELVLLDKEKATPKYIAGIIGNTSWTTLRCDECEKEVTAVIEVGEEKDYESSTARLCFSCLKQAYRSFSKVKL